MVRRFRAQLVAGAWATSLFAGVFVVHALSPISTSLDSRWSVPVALSLLDHHATYVDDYITLTKNPSKARNSGLYVDYAVECVSPDRTIVRSDYCSPGHYYSFYPAALSAVAAPVVLALRMAVPVMSPLLLNLAEHGAPIPRSFVEGDFVKSREYVEVVVASFFVALTTVVVFLSARLFLPDTYSAFLGLVFAFATPAWSSASRALWQHAPSMFFVSTTVYLLLLGQKAEKESSPWAPRLIALAAVPTALAYAVRPTNSLWVLAISLYVAVHHRRYLGWYLLAALPIAAVFVIYNETIYHRVLPTYFSLQAGFPKRFSDTYPMFNGWAGALVSPSRGVFVYTPIFLFSIWGMILAVKERWYGSLPLYFCAVIVGNWLLLGYYWLWWWAGHSYGPRYFSDVSPLFILFLVPVLWKWRASAKWPPSLAEAAFAVSVAASVFIHSRGARSVDVYWWNTVPINVDQRQSRLWDWSDPQFLRGLLPPPKYVSDTPPDLTIAEDLVPELLDGSLDVADYQQIAGWAWDKSRPNEPVRVEIYDGPNRIASVTANLFRQDLLDARVGNGAHGFSYRPFTSSQLSGTHTVRAFVSGKELVGSPTTTRQ